MSVLIRVLILLPMLCGFGPARTLEAERIEPFLDIFFAKQMEAAHIPGAVFTLVKDGRVLISRGYGVADLKTGAPVDPEKTVFRAASVSKVFTTTAIMQLYERGRLRLDDDVNRYLRSFRIEDDYPEPVTLASLLTHTAGFDGRAIGMAAKNPADVLPLGEYLARRMPPRIRPPGELVSYSNHGLALAGHVVETVSGMSFEAYMEKHVLEPLGMSRSSFTLPERLKPNLASGYLYSAGDHRRVPFAYLHVAPAGSLITTGSDAARFALAHLEGGAWNGARILSEETTRAMHRRHFSHHPKLAGFAYGFYERYQNGVRAILHDGDLTGFSSRLLLVPEERLGFFLSYNRADLRFREDLTSAFFDRFYPAAKEPGESPRTRITEGLDRFAGTYRWSRFAYRTMEKINSLLAQFRVIPAGDGTVTVRYPPVVGGSSRWAQVEPGLFRRLDRSEYMYFREDEEGRIAQMFLSVSGFPFALERIPRFAMAVVQIGLMIFFVFVFLSPFPLWGHRRLIRKLRKGAPEAPGWPPAVRWLVGTISSLNVMFLVVLAVAPSRIELMQFTYGLPPPLVMLLALPLVTTALTGVLVVLSIRAWQRRLWPIGPRIHISVVTLVAAAFIPFLHYWNLLGFRY